jgi:branched-chain amino acid transport system ATP-binding protein
MSTLTIKNFHKSFDGLKAVNDVTFNIEKHKITGLIGPNGSGKSTVINLITAVKSKDKGFLIIGDHVRVDKIRPFDMFTYKITRTFQNVKVFEQMSVLDNILVVLTNRNVWSALFGGFLNSARKSFYNEKAEEVLKRIGLHEKRNELAINLSYGQRKLLEIGRAIAMDAEYILFDEPYAGLFPEMIKKVSLILKELRDEGKAIVLVEHNMDIIRDVCDHLIVMDAGEVLAEGEPLSILKNRDVIEAYLGE